MRSCKKRKINCSLFAKFYSQKLLTIAFICLIMIITQLLTFFLRMVEIMLLCLLYKMHVGIISEQISILFVIFILLCIMFDVVHFVYFCSDNSLVFLVFFTAELLSLCDLILTLQISPLFHELVLSTFELDISSSFLEFVFWIVCCQFASPGAALVVHSDLPLILTATNFMWVAFSWFYIRSGREFLVYYSNFRFETLLQIIAWVCLPLLPVLRSRLLMIFVIVLVVQALATVIN